MLDSDKQPFADYLRQVLKFYKTEVDPPLLRAWWALLVKYDFADVQAAFNNHLLDPDHGQFQPKPADIVRAIEGSTQDAGALAWARVETALREYGCYESVVFDDPLIHSVVYALGGWVKLGQTETDEMPFLAQRFATLYRGHKQRRQLPPYPGILAGIHDGNNAVLGFDKKPPPGFVKNPPIAIGNLEMCRQVRKGLVSQGLVQVGAVKTLAITEEQTQ